MGWFGALERDMDAMEAVERLARRAAGEAAPAVRIDMAAVVAEARRQRSFMLPLRWSAAVSAVAACLVMAAALLWSTTTASGAPAKTDSMDALFAPLQVEMP